MAEETVERPGRSQMWKHEDAVAWLTEEGLITPKSTQAEVVAAFAAHRNRYRKTERYLNLENPAAAEKEKRAAERAAAKEAKAAEREAAKAAKAAEREKAAAAKAAAKAAAESAPKSTAKAAPAKATKATKKAAATEDNPFA